MRKMGKMNAFVVAIVLALCCFVVKETESVCCTPDFQPSVWANNAQISGPKGSKACGNGEIYTSGCCGRGSCNIFCCNCDDGCIPKLSSGRAISNASPNKVAKEYVRLMDKDKDSRVSKGEFSAYRGKELKSRPQGRGADAEEGEEGSRTMDSFEDLDKDGDGFLTADEIDH